MAWIESHQELGHHPKLLRLCRVLNISQPQAVGHLQFLWWWAVDYCDDGNLTRFDALDIAIAGMWDGEPEAFLNALIACGWVDRALDEMFIHDWQIYLGKLLHRRASNAERQARHRDNLAKSSDSNSHVTRDKRVSNGSSRVTNSATKPNQTEPNQGDTSVEVSSAAPPPKPKRKSRLSAEWKPSETNTAYAKEQGFSDAEIARQAELFRDHWLANGETKDDWDATWRNWIRRAPEFDRSRAKVVSINGRSHSAKPDFVEIARDLRAKEHKDPWD